VHILRRYHAGDALIYLGKVTSNTIRPSVRRAAGRQRLTSVEPAHHPFRASVRPYPEQPEKLRQLGCPYAHGFLLARLVPFEQCRRYLTGQPLDTDQAGAVGHELEATGSCGSCNLSTRPVLYG
jgi:hypothetical protein